jgi:hypothetical protein
MTLFLDIEGAPTNNTNDLDRRPLPIRTLRRARRLRKHGYERGGPRNTKKFKKAFGLIGDARKTKMLAEIDGLKNDCDDSDAEFSRGTNNTSHAKAPSNSTYCKGDD